MRGGVWRGDGYVTGRFGRVRKVEEASGWWWCLLVASCRFAVVVVHPLLCVLVSAGSSGKSSFVSGTFHRWGWGNFLS